MDFDHVSIGVLQEHLVPTCNCPLAIVGVLDSKLIALAHEAFDVVRTEAKVPTRHRIDDLVHLEAGVYVALSPMELDGTVVQKVDLAVVPGAVAARINPSVFFVFDRAEIKQRLIELGEPGQAVSAQIQVMELEIHDRLADGIRGPAVPFGRSVLAGLGWQAACFSTLG